MGGGDLNLKKSWHPQTIHNIEKVWKAEQKAEAEAKKIEQLQRELHEERQREEMQRYAVDQGIAKKKSDRLEWMYSAPGHAGINHEDYLLGKSIDKAVDPLAINDEKNAEAPGASFMSNDSPSASNDLAAKIRDDPLFMIKKKENEKKKELLKNPVRMKQLQQLLKADLGKKGRKDKKDKKRKKEKKNRNSPDEDKKNKYRSKSSSNRRKGKDSESSEDTDRHETVGHRSRRNEKSHRNSAQNGGIRNGSEYKHFKYNENRIQRTYSSSPERYTVSEDRPSQRSHEDMNNSVRKNNKRRYSSRSKSPSPIRRPPRKKSPPWKRQRGDTKLDSYSKERRYRTSEVEEDRRHRDKQRSRSSSPTKHTSREHSSSNSRSYATKKSRQSESTASRKMTDEERERRLAEMMENAKWRDEQRGKNVKRYKEEDEAEAKRIEQNTQQGANFVQPMKVQTYTSSTASVENRIKRNINSLQRTPAAMEKFLKK